MFKKIGFNYNLALTLAIISGICALLISFVNNVTAPVIEENLVAKTQELYSEIFPKMDDYKTEAVNDSVVNSYTVVYQDEKEIGAIVEATGKNPYGEITVLVGIDNEGNVVGIQYSNFNQTPGFGDKVQTSKYMKQYEGLMISEDVNVDSVSGATYSSNLVRDLVASSMEYANKQVGDSNE